ncbi:MAG: two-component system, OmpR family, sensor kinase [Actinomycetota bacterium]
MTPLLQAGSRSRASSLEGLVGLCDTQAGDISALETVLVGHALAGAERELARKVFIHEVRNQMTVIGGFLDVLSDENLPAGASDMVMRCRRQTGRLLDLVASQGPSADDSTLEPLAMDVVLVADVVAEVVVAASAELEGRSVSWLAPAGLSVRAENTRLRQVLLNLVLNAARHTPPGSPIALEAISGENDVTLVVSDRGPGMNGEAESLCMPFRRGADVGGEGRGLGLYLARRITASLGGRVEFAERVGGGLEVRVVLPQRAGREVA